MARPKKIQTEKVTKSYTGSDVPERMQLGGIGNTGLRAVSGYPLEETVKELQWPNNVRIYQTMQNDSVISAATDFFQMLIKRSTWAVRRSSQDTPEMTANIDFLEQCMKDMDHSWGSALQEASSMIIYGHSILEKVYRKRLRSKGSKFNDGKIGLKKLAPRSQASIVKFIYDNDELIGIRQNLNLMQGNAFRTYDSSTVVIPVEKLLLFRCNTQRDNPVGRSPLASVYFDWKYRCAIQENESIGAARDLQGIPMVSLPPQYLSADASPDQKAIVDYYKGMVNNISSGHQSGIIMPNAYDQESKQKLFEFSLLSSVGNKAFNTNEIINRYDRKILTKLMADLLIMGQTATGSFALGTIKSELVNLAVEAHLTEIRDVLNKDLVQQLFNLNGIFLEVYPELYFEDLSLTDIDTFSKAVQRFGAVGFLEKDIPTLNSIRAMLGVEALPNDFDIAGFKLENSKIQSKSGQGLESGMPSGTGNADGSSGDSSVANSENV